MIRIRRADETVIGSSDKVPETLDLACDLIDKLFGALARAGRSGLDLLAVLVRTCHETDIKAVRSLITGDAVRKDDLVGIADMGLS